MERSQAKFFKTDVVHVFLKIEEQKSRGELVAETGIGEGSMRSILDILKQNELIESSRQGHTLTKRGKTWKKRLMESVAVADPGRLQGLNKFEVVCLHIKPPLEPRPSYQLRDIAVRWGAAGALIFEYNGKSLVLPPSKTVDYEGDYSSLERLGLLEGDYVVVIWGESKTELLPGGIEIASKLSHTVKKFMEAIE